MSPNNPSRILITAFAALLLLIPACERKLDNPWDEKTTLNPNDWAPQNFQVETINPVERKLTWNYMNYNIEGFKIDRKRGNDPWQIPYQNLPKNVRTLTDTVTIDQGVNYQYRLYAYAGNKQSESQDTSFAASFTAPENLTIIANSATSVTLNWSYGLTGHEGFRIERKIDEGSWEMMEDSLNPNQNIFNDIGLDLYNNVYYYRIFAFFYQYESSKVENLVSLICGYPSTDNRDGIEYATIQIGNQCWMKENLKWLPVVNPPANGSNTSAKYYTYGYHGSSVGEAKGTGNYQTYGVLYNWPAALSACPQGWHLPSDGEWSALIDFLGGSSEAGGKMKTTGTTHWKSPNTGATNESEFSGLPGGLRYYDSNFDYIGFYGYWWSSTESLATTALYRYLNNNNAYANRNTSLKERGFSVRCLRD